MAFYFCSSATCLRCDTTKYRFDLSQDSWCSSLFLNPPPDVFGNYSGSWLEKITNSLQACEKLRRTALGCGDAKRVLTDYGKRLSYPCVGPQPSRNSKTVSTHPPFMDYLSDSD